MAQIGGTSTAFFLSFFRFIRLLLSVFTLSLTAKYFGVDIDRDYWLLSFNFVLVLNQAIWGPLNEIFRTKFIFIRETEGEVLALNKTRSVLFISVLVLIGISVFVFLFSEPIAHFLAPRYNPIQVHGFAQLLRFLIWSLALSQTALLLSSILNAYDSFYIPEITAFIAAIINLLIISFFAGQLGIYALMLGHYISVLLLLTILIRQIRKLNIPVFEKPGTIKLKDALPFLIYSLPFFMPYLVGQCSALLEKSLASNLGQGSVSVMDYARKLSDIAQTVVTSVLTTIFVPILSKQFVQFKNDVAQETILKYLRMILLLFAFVLPIFVFCAHEISFLLFNKGSILEKELNEISRLTQMYGLSLIPVIFYVFFGLILLSNQKGKIYAICGVFVQIIMIICNYFFYQKLGVYIFSVTLFASHLLASIFMFRVLPVSAKKILASSYKYCLLIFAVFAGLYCLDTYVSIQLGIFQMFCLKLFFLILSLFVFSWLLKLSELKQLKQFVQNKFR